MKTTTIIEAFGSITKKEALTRIEYKTLENTFVAESGDPYADYYGQIPHSLAPNSLFLFTKQFYPLEDVLSITCDMKEFFGYIKNLDVATSILDFTDHFHYALRIRDFPDYDHVHWLQTCYINEGVEFCKKVNILDWATVTVFKSFNLEKLDEGIYLDSDHNNKGYILMPSELNSVEFGDLLLEIRNNNDCELFDAAIGTIEIDEGVRNIIRIYSENMNINILRCIQQKVLKLNQRKQLLQY